MGRQTDSASALKEVFDYHEKGKQQEGYSFAKKSD